MLTSVIDNVSCYAENTCRNDAYLNIIKSSNDFILYWKIHFLAHDISFPKTKLYKELRSRC